MNMMRFGDFLSRCSLFTHQPSRCQPIIAVTANRPPIHLNSAGYSLKNPFHVVWLVPFKLSKRPSFVAQTTEKFSFSACQRCQQTALCTSTLGESVSRRTSRFSFSWTTFERRTRCTEMGWDPVRISPTLWIETASAFVASWMHFATHHRHRCCSLAPLRSKSA